MGERSWGVAPGFWEEGDGTTAPHPRPWLTQDSDYVVAVRNFLPEDPALLAFHKGDIIHLQPLEPPRMGQGRGTQGGRERRLGRGPPWQVLTSA